MSSLTLITIVLCLTAGQLFAFEVSESVPGFKYKQEAVELERQVLAPFTYSKQQNKLIDTYIKSHNAELRRKALPILKELAANNNISAIRVLALLESNGDLGYVSYSTFDSHKALLQRYFPETTKTILQSHQMWGPVLTSKLDLLDNIYQTHLPVCEQPLDEMPATLVGDEKAALYIGYLERCLHRYTFSNPSLRLMGLSELYGVHCKFESANKTCLKSGYVSIATGKMNSNNLASTAYALFNEYVARYQLMRPKKDKPKKTLTREAIHNITHVLSFYRNNDVESTLAELDKLVKQAELTEQDRAYYNYILVQLLYAENKQPKRANELFKSLIASNFLPFDEYWTIFDSYTQILLNDERYEAVIRLLANEFLKYDKNSNVLPQKHLRALLANLPE